MKQILLRLLLLAALILPWASHAQSISEYAVSVDPNGNFSSIASTGTALTLSSNDDGYATVSVPFNFPFGDATFNAGFSIAASANGYLYLDTTRASGSAASYTSSYHVINAIIHADAHMGHNAGAAVYTQAVSTNDGGQAFVIEYHGLSTYSSPYAYLSYQVILFSNGNIDIVFDSCNMNGSSSTLRCFLRDGAHNENLFLKDSWTTPNLSTSAETMPNATLPNHGLTIHFRRSGAGAIVSFSANAPTGQSLLYTFLQGNTVEVSARNVHSGWANNGQSSGELLIPSTVTYNGVTYSVTSIRNDAFKGCEGLTTVSIPNSVTTIGTNAFYGCVGLTTVTIPNSVTTIGNNAFFNVLNINYRGTATGQTWGALYMNRYVDGYLVYEDSTMRSLLRCGTTATSATIPNTVTTIASAAFRYCSALTSVTIPNTVTSISQYMFEGCSSLTSVTIPNSVQTIGYEAFYNCTGLSSITIPNSVRTIGTNAFYNCTGLTTIVLPNSVTNIGQSVFDNCSNLDTIISLNFIPPSCNSYTFNNITTSVVVLVPTGCGNRYRSATGWSQCINIQEMDAYVAANGLRYWLYTLDGVNYAELMRKADGTSYDASSYTIPSSVTKDGVTYPVTCIRDSVFFGCSSLISVTIQNSMISIGNYAFMGCSSLISVSIPNSMKTIGSSAFRNCSSLLSMSIPNSVNSIGNYAFYNCTSLSSVALSDSLTAIGNYLFYSCIGLSSVNIPNSVTSIGNYAFYNCQSLASIALPNSLTSIGSYAFNGCNGATGTLAFPNSLKSIGGHAFYGCTGLSGSLILPDALETIGEYCFYNCTSLTDTLIIGNNVTNINRYTFCSNKFSAITIGQRVTSIGNDAFYNNDNVKRIVIPDAVRTIDSYAFYSCDSLMEVTIGTGLTSIGSQAFYYCRNLQTLNYNAVSCSFPTVSSTSSLPFYYTKLKNVTIGNSVRTIPAYFMYNQDSLKSIEIPSSVVSISNYAFANCDKLVDVRIGDSVQVVNSYVFNNCTSLPSITFPNAVTNIETSALEGCTNLQSVVVSSSIARFGNRAFYGCSQLKELTMRAQTPPFCGTNAFYNLPADRDLYVPCGASASYNNWQGFDPNRTYETTLFHIDLQVNDTTYGTAFYECASPSGDDLYSATLTASPIPGGRFVMWSDGDTINPRTVTLTQDSAFTALFERDVTFHLITAISSDTLQGTVLGGGMHGEEDTITLTAIPTTGYHFHHWQDNDRTNPRQWVVSGVETFVAYFAIDTHLVATANEDTTYGTVSGLGRYTYGSTATLTATPTYGHHFTGWSNGMESNPYTLTIVSDTTINALFALNDYTLTALCDPSNGTTTGSGTYPYNSQATLSATPWQHYQFAQWSDGNTDNPRTITVSGNLTLSATFAYHPDTVTLHDTTILDHYIHDTTYVDVFIHDTTIVDHYVHDTTYVDVFVHDTTIVDHYVHDTTIVTEYVPVHDTTTVWQYDTTYIDHYVHDTTYLWQHDTTIVNRYVHDTTYITLIDTVTITDTLVRDLNYYTLSVISGNSSQGLVAGNGEFPEGTEVEIAAIPLEGNRFVQWHDGNTENPRIVTLLSSATYVATFEASSAGVSEIELSGITIGAERGQINVMGAQEQTVRIFDALGRCLTTESRVAEVHHFRVPSTGTYFVQVGDMPARKVVVLK